MHIFSCASQRYLQGALRAAIMFPWLTAQTSGSLIAPKVLDNGAKRA